MNHIHELRRCCFDMSAKSKSPSIMRKRVTNANSTFMKSSEWVPSRKIPEKTKETKMALITIRRWMRSALACASLGCSLQNLRLEGEAGLFSGNLPPRPFFLQT